MSALPVRTRALAALLVLTTAACFPGGVTTDSRMASNVSANTVPASPASVSTAAAPLPSVIIKDKKGKPVAGIPVTFAVTAGGGSVSGGSQTTNAQGIATVGGWMLGPTVGNQSLLASAEPLPEQSAAADKLPTVTFSVDARPAAPSQMAKINDGQTGTVGAALAQQVGVLLKDGAGNAVAGTSVTFTAGNGSSVSPSTVATNVSGQAMTTWTLGTAAGGASLTATSGTLTPATFSATAVAGPAAQLAKLNDGQSGTVGYPLTNKVGVTVTDSYGNPVSGVAVAFAGANGSAVSPASVNTDASGVAQTQWSMGTVAGPVSASATVGSLAPASFSATAVAGPPAQVSKENDAQTGTVGAALALPVTLVVKDSYGNPVKDASVSFAPGNGSSVPSTSVLTNASGRASTSWTMATQAGWISMSASVGTVSPATFTAEGLAGPASQLTGQGDNQIGDPGTTLGQPIAVFVADQYGNAVRDAQVNFVPGAGSVNPTAPITGLDGLASTNWTLGTNSGGQTLTATVGSLTPLTFNATATAADPCSAISSLGVPQGVNGDLTFAECTYGTRGVIDLWSLPLTSSTPMEVWAESPDFDSYLAMYRGSYTDQVDQIGMNDDGFSTGTNSRIQFLGGAGDFLIGVTNFGVEKGTYRLSTKTWNGAVTACNQVFAVAGTSTTQILDNSDCKRGTRWADKVTMYLRAGETIQITMHSTVFYPTVEVDRRVNGIWTKVASDPNTGNTTDSRVTLTAAVSDYYMVYETSNGTTAVGGAYSLSILTPPAGTPAVTASVRSTRIGEEATRVMDNYRNRTKERTITRTPSSSAKTQ
ncbi:MAG TPA: Ig-like domain-containing protein [Gemmatimonadaceae bacterium]|nr:Ig-like domain-containing protein [Gemmatimonadaceae bacterium]